MFRMIVTYVGAGLALGGCLWANPQEERDPGTPNAFDPSAVLSRYCITCHNQNLQTAGLMLDAMDLDNVPEGAEVWEKVIRKLRARQMPPAGMPRPDEATYDSFATYLETEIDRAAEARPNPGRVAIHRLNRAEYANVIRDLLAIDIDGESLLPADDAAHGFDNIGDALTVSPALLERYMLAAEKISRLAIGDSTISPVLNTYEVPDSLVQDDHMNEYLPFGSRGGIAMRHFFPLDAEYVIKIRLKRNNLGEILGIDEPKRLDVRLDGSRIQLFAVGSERHRDRREDVERDYDYRSTADEGLEVRFPAKAGTRMVGVTFLKENVQSSGEFRVGRRAVFEGVDSVTISGPYNATGPGETPSRSRIFVCRPTSSEDEEPCARKILSTLARRAYRRPVTEEDIQPLLNLYQTGRSNGGFEAGIQTALRGMLVLPGFLFRLELDPVDVAPGAAYGISDYDLASRLSFFLWSSIPDDQLLDLAEQGQLRDPVVLEQQVRRMLADSRSEALVNNFAGQWLYLRNLGAKAPDSGVFPEFDENLRQAFQRETELFFASIVREDRSVVDLLGADYTFLNERLARHYQIPNVYGSRFRRVTLNDEQRKGLLGQGSLLTVTSYNTRTSPVLRGMWLLENILGTPPPPPPPDVPSLKEDQDTEALTMRERMEQHRENPACAVCHRVMDPLGFALENFDAIGRWRTTSGAADAPVDASGELPDGTRFDGPAELREILLSKREQFVETFTEKLLTYALGRGVEYSDRPSIRKIVREAAPDYRWSSLILSLVQSTPFQMRRSREQ